jgi:hypothetical protein
VTIKQETKEQIGHATFQFSISATGLISRPFLGSSGILKLSVTCCCCSCRLFFTCSAVLIYHWQFPLEQLPKTIKKNSA